MESHTGAGGGNDGGSSDSAGGDGGSSEGSGGGGAGSDGAAAGGEGGGGCEGSGEGDADGGGEGTKGGESGDGTRGCLCNISAAVKMMGAAIVSLPTFLHHNRYVGLRTGAMTGAGDGISASGVEERKASHSGCPLSTRSGCPLSMRRQDANSHVDAWLEAGRQDRRALSSASGLITRARATRTGRLTGAGSACRVGSGVANCFRLGLYKLRCCRSNGGSASANAFIGGDGGCCGGGGRGGGGGRT